MNGFATLPASEKVIGVVLRLEWEGFEEEKFMTMMGEARGIVSLLSERKIIEVKDACARILINSAYGQSNYDPILEDFVMMEEELELEDLVVNQKDVLLVFSPPGYFPGMRVYCDLDKELNVDELRVYITA